MVKVINIFLRISAVFLYAMGFIYILRDQIYPDYKLGRIPWWVTISALLILLLPTFALYLIPSARNYKTALKIIIGIILVPAILITSFNSYDCLLSLSRNAYREGFLYIFSFCLGTISITIGYFMLIFQKKSK